MFLYFCFMIFIKWRFIEAPYILRMCLCWQSIREWVFNIMYSYRINIKGISSDSNNIFLWLESEDVNKKAYFQNFSWFKFYVFKLCMVMCVSLLPSHRLLFWKSRVRDFVKIALISYRNYFSQTNSFGEVCFLQESYENMQNK